MPGGGQLPDKCFNCINLLHCSFGCPDYCLMNAKGEENSFVCEVNQMLVLHYLKQSAFDRMGARNG